MRPYPRLSYMLLTLTFSAISLFSFSMGLYSGHQEPPALSRIIIGQDSVISVGPGNKNYDQVLNGLIVLRKKGNSIAFEYSGTEWRLFRYFLEGFDEGWSMWTGNGTREYTNLPAGRYTFRSAYQETDGQAEDLLPVRFRVLPSWYTSWPSLLVFFIAFILLVWAFYDQLNFRFARTQYMLEQIINKRTEDLIIEKEKTEALLSNVLPKNTADEIMSKGKATKMKYNFVTVLFSDIQGFTKIAEEMNPEVLIDELDKFFFHFDSVVEKYGIEKIKTIGDAYMCAGGIPEKNRTNPVEVILAALEMQQYMEKLKASSEIAGMKYWDIRIGIHTGTVIAGVVGHKKLSYDIWGDTVNTASRMESSGTAGKINISGTTFEFVREFFDCEYRGKMPVKYKGELDMYFVDKIKDELRDENGGPNTRFILKIQLLKLQDIEEYIIKMYDEEASPNLYFHNPALVKSICNQVELLANAEQLPEEDFIILKLASLFLFTGYINDYDKPEEASCRLVNEILPGYGFGEEDIERIRLLITNSYAGITETLPDKILFDSKYDYTGRVDYTRLTDKLIKELSEYGKITDKNQWIEEQIQFLAEHDFFTGTAKLLRSVTVERQISDLKDYAVDMN